MTLRIHITGTAAAGAIRRILSKRKVSLISANCFGLLHPLSLSLMKNITIKKHARKHTVPVSCHQQRAGLTILLV